MLKLKSIVESLQVHAYTNKTKVFVAIKGKTLASNIKNYVIDLKCENVDFYFNEDGNISRALTIRCGNKRMVLQLGSGINEIR